MVSKRNWRNPHFRIGLILILILVIASWSMAAVTGKIAGKVIDSQSGVPIPGANVVIIGTTMGAATDIDGEYYIINVPPGAYSVRVTMMGYSIMTKTDVTVNVDRTTRVDFKLQETAIEVGEAITITAERPLVERDETSTRHFVEAREISSRPAMELTQILSTLPGIDQSGSELLVRRGSLDQVAFLIDGIRARNPLDFQPYHNINLTAIQELEIITGGFNAEYGEAQSGVFNIITKEGSNNFEGYAELRWTPPGLYHWGTAFYDYSTDRYWENTHARHLQWWIDNPDQWVDDRGAYGNDPNCNWTPEQAYNYYLQTHQPLNDYTNQSGYQAELALGGPLPIKNLFFFVSGKYRTRPPITGNAYRSLGTWIDGNAKLTYQINNSMKLMFSGIYGEANTCYGMESMEVSAGLENKYVYYDYQGYPTDHINGQILKFTHLLSKETFYELFLSRYYHHHREWTFPDDPDGWETGSAVTDNLRALDENGDHVFGGYSNFIGLHYLGYIYRNDDRNTHLTLSGDLTSQLTKKWQIKGGFDFTYYILDRFQEAKAYNTREDRVYHPYEGDLYLQSKLEFEGLIMNLGLRYDFYNPNDDVYINLFDPLDLIAAEKENREPNPITKPSNTYGQLSPRIGISHPISDKTVLHFSYGHFFQRANFGDYGEGTGGDAPRLRMTGILNTTLTNPEFGSPLPYNIGNRNLKPKKTVAYELGIERNFGGLVMDITGFYKDISKTIRSVKIIMENNAQYLTTGNSDYEDTKGVEVSVRKPLSGYWGGYLNYTWMTGIAGTSGDPAVIVAPGAMAQVAKREDIGDVVLYIPSNLKFGLTFATPEKFSPFKGILSNIQLSLHYQIYYPHKQLIGDIFGGAYPIIRPADKEATVGLRKEVKFFGLKPSVFFEMYNAFNDKHLNVHPDLTPEAEVRFINSNLGIYPDKLPNGAPFPDMTQYRNLPRRIVFGFALTF